MNSVAPQAVLPSWGIVLILVILILGVAAVVTAVRHGKIGALAVACALILGLVFLTAFFSASVRVQQGPSLTALPTLQPVSSLSKTSEASVQANLVITWLIVVSLIVAPLGLGFAIKQGLRRGNLMTLGMFLGATMLLGLGLITVKWARFRTQEVVSSHHETSKILPVDAPLPIQNDLPVASPGKIEHGVGYGPFQSVPELPEWRKNPPLEGSLEQGASRYVRVSRQYATVEEAEAELFQSLATDVQQGFTKHWPETQGWMPTRDDITSSGLIQEKVIESIPLKVGEFDNTVFRVSWLIEFRPESNKALHARWYPLEAERRSRWLLAALAGITGLMGGTAIVLRRQRVEAAPPAQTA